MPGEQLSSLVEDAKAVKGSPKALKEHLRKLDTITDHIRKAGMPEERIPRDKLKAGDTVFIVPLDKKGKLTSDPVGGKVDVALGSVRMTIAVSDLVGLGSPGQRSPGARHKLPEPVPNRSGMTAELNIIGFRVEEAIDKLEKFLDMVYSRNDEGCRIIHGKGTGALRSSVHEYLSSSSYVAKYHMAQPNEGGEGATMVSFHR